MTYRRAATLLLVPLLWLTPSARAEGQPDFDDYFQRYYDAERGELYRYDDHREENGKRYADYWWQAHLFEATIDRYRATGRPEDKERMRTVLRDFLKNHPDWRDSRWPWARNRFNDDLGWWAVACLHAYEVTGEPEYLAHARRLYGKITPPGDDGAVPWTSPRSLWERSIERGDDRNVATNGLYVQLTAKLAQHDPARREEYLERARRAQAWLESNLVQRDDPHGFRLNDTVHRDGSVDHAQYSYNYGNLVAADLALYEATGEQRYKDQAIEAGRAAVLRAKLPQDQGGLARDTSDGASDGAGFDQILYRDLALLVPYGQGEWVLPFLQDRARESPARPTGGAFRALGQATLPDVIAASSRGRACPAPPPPPRARGITGALGGG